MPELAIKIQKTLSHHLRTLQHMGRGIWWHTIQQHSIRPIFVVGCSRGGTTVVYKTLSESLQLGTLQRETHDFWSELHPLAKQHWNTHALGENDASDHDREFVANYFYRWTGRNRWVDKNNRNGLCIPYLKALFPSATFVFVKRSPGDNLNSLIEGWGKPDKYATWSHDLPANVAIEGGRYTRWCFFLAAGWRDYLRSSIEEVAAFQYDAINSAIIEARRSVPTNQWVEVFYEDLVRDPIGGYQRLFEECALDFSPKVRNHCENILEKPYDVFGEIELDKWKKGRNRERVERVLDRVAGAAREMGYPHP